MTKDVTLRAVTSYAVRTRSPVTSRAAVVYAHKNETIDVITSKKKPPNTSFVRTKHLHYWL